MPFPNTATQIKPGEVRNPKGGRFKYSAQVIYKLLEETPYEKLPKDMQKIIRDKYGVGTLKEALALSMIKKALLDGASSVPAYNAVYDRLEGKPTQSIDMDVTNGPEMSEGELARRLASLLVAGVTSTHGGADGVPPKQGETNDDQTNPRSSGSDPAGPAGGA